MKKFLIRLLLIVLNGQWLNASPCRYGFIGNIDAFDRDHLESENRARPGITVRTILDEATAFKCCPLRKDGGVTVIESGEYRDADVWDLHELNQTLIPKN